ncbi:MAG: type IV secretory system conjugative DNA transfer family protein [Lachnospiraceae bacterium]|nr:type IV secretory system conjugative DNA transfer family protein [Lachnospiraceae bacterium]
MLKNIGLIFKTKKLRKELFVMWLLMAISAVYLICMLHYFLSTKEFSANPIEYFRYFSSSGNNPYRYLVLAIPALMIFGLVNMAKKLDELELDPRNFHYSKSGVYGTAHMMTEEEMKDVALVQKVEDCNGTILGQFDKSGKTVINMRNDAKDLRINRHVLVFGASQSGKTFCYAKPFCYQAAKRRESLIITDPKGELYEDTAEYFRNKGYVIKKFDIKTPLMSDGWDCLSEIRGDDLRASIFADVVIRNTSDGHGRGGDPIFEDGPKALLKAVLLLVANSNRYGGPGQKPRSFATAFELVKDAGEMGESGLDMFFNAADACQEARDAYRLFKNSSVNLRGNLITGLGTRLQVLANKTIKEITGQNDIDLTLPGKRPCVYYCIMSDQQGTFNFLSALFFSFLFIDLVEFADQQPNRACPVPVNFLLDEFANIGSIPDFEKKIATIRSRALNVSIICQDISQLQYRYPDTYASIMSNCATHLCIGFNDLETQAYYEKRAGETTVKTSTEQHPAKDPLFSLGMKHSTGDGRRSILTSDELARLTPDECLIVFQAHNVVKALKFAHTQHPESKLTRHIQSGKTPPITDIEARRRIKMLEDERVRKFDEWYANGCIPSEKPEVIPLEDLEAGTASLTDYISELKIDDEDELDLSAFGLVEDDDSDPSSDASASGEADGADEFPELPEDTDDDPAVPTPPAKDKHEPQTKAQAPSSDGTKKQTAPQTPKPTDGQSERTTKPGPAPKQKPAPESTPYSEPTPSQPQGTQSTFGQSETPGSSIVRKIDNALGGKTHGSAKVKSELKAAGHRNKATW